MTDTPPPGKRTPTQTIPDNVEVVELRRSTYGEFNSFYLTVKGEGWNLTTTVKDADVLTRIQEIAAAVEAVK